MAEWKQKRPPTYNHRPPPSNLRDDRTFAEILNSGRRNEQPTNSHPPPPTLAPILLRREHGTHNWLRKTTLIGEAISIDLRKLIKPKDGSIEIKYIGGLKVILEFGNSVNAREFKDNESNWRNSITRTFGKTIAPFEETHHRVDLSCAKIGILTNKKSRINDEIYVAIEGEFDPRKGFLEDEFGRDAKFESNGETAGKEDGMEESEIPPEPVSEVHIEMQRSQDRDESNKETEVMTETEAVNDDEHDAPAGNQVEGDSDQPMTGTMSVGPMKECQQSPEEDPQTVQGSRLEDESPPKKLVALTSNDNTPVSQIHVSSSGPNTLNHFGLIDGLRMGT
ncbi:hypothetical protein LXL04_019279 [Taraxacum kok-saghyz]